MKDDNTLIPIEETNITELIYTIRGKQVMIDRDLAYLYNVETKALNQAVKRNISRFPESFRFQISDDEKDELVTNCDRFKTLKHSSLNPYAYTEQSITMLSNREMFAHLDRVELRQLETDKKLEEVFDYIATTKEMNKNSLDNG